MKITIIYLVIIIISLFMMSNLFAQPPFGNPEQAPIDGGLALLAAAGGTYALKKLRDRNNRKEI